MKTVYFMRHGKAEKRTKSVSDLKRSLSPRGKREARLSALAIKKKLAPRIDCIISSPAVRAMETANIFMATLGLHELSIYAEELVYTAGTDSEILEFLLSLDDSKSDALIVAHNPVLSDVVHLFVPELKAIIPTAGIVGLTFNVDTWKEAARVQPAIAYMDLKKRKLKKSGLTSRQKSDMREKSISFLVANIKELGVDQESIPEELLAITIHRIMSTLYKLIDELSRRSKCAKKKVKQNA
jgi:phosphohistidine phosphatase